MRGHLAVLQRIFGSGVLAAPHLTPSRAPFHTSLTTTPSSRRESHPPALTDPDVNLSIHPARAIQLPGRVAQLPVRKQAGHPFPDTTQPCSRTSVTAFQPFPATSAHSCDSFLTVDHTHQPGRPHPLAPPPLRYAGTSQLLRVSPPARPATVLGSLRIPPLGVLPLATNCSVTVSRRAFTCSVREPGPDSCCLYAGHHLGSRRVTPRLIPEQRPNPGFDVISLAFDASVGRGPFDPSLIFPVHT